MIKQHYDKILLGIALIVLAVAFVFAVIRPSVQPGTEVEDFVLPQAHNTYQVSEFTEPDLSVPAWSPPPSQSAGEEWVFDLFTPPNIEFDRVAQTFRVEGVDRPAAEPFGVQLVAMEQRRYRIQLVGHGGRPGGYFLNLRDEEERRDVLAFEGRDYPDLEISIREVAVEQRRVQHEGRTEVIERVARAVIFDHRIGQEVVLYSDRLKMAEGQSARFRVTLAGHEGEEFHAQDGGSFRVGNYIYHVVEMNAHSATVTRQSPDPEADPRTEVLRAAYLPGERIDDSADESEIEAVSPAGEAPVNGQPDAATSSEAADSEMESPF